MNRPISYQTLPRAAFQALMALVKERFPATAQKLLGRLRNGADTNRELLVPVRMLVYNILGEKSYERYTGYEWAAMQGDRRAETAWIRMLNVCRMLIARPAASPAICLN